MGLHKRHLEIVLLQVRLDIGVPKCTTGKCILRLLCSRYGYWYGDLTLISRRVSLSHIRLPLTDVASFQVKIHEELRVQANVPEALTSHAGVTPLPSLKP